MADGRDGTQTTEVEHEPEADPGMAPVIERERSRSLMERADDVLAVAEGAVLWPVRRLRALRGEIRSWELDEAAGASVPAPGSAQPLTLTSFLRRPVAGPVTALASLVLVYIVVFGALTYRQQSNYGTFGFDMGIYDQGIWLLAHFKTPFDTIRGLNYFGQHVNIVTLLFVPAYWLGAGPHFLFAVETVWMAAGAIPIWLLGRDRMGNSWIPLGLSAAYLLYPSVEWINEWMFHPDALIITPLMFAYWLATRRRWGWFWVATALALSCKEDAGLAVLALGLVLWLRLRQRSWGLLTTVVGAGWFLACTKLIIPLANGGGQPFYTSLFPGYGNSVFAIIKTLVIHPTRWIKQAVTAPNLTYYAQLLWPVGMVALLEPAVLLVALPQLLVNVISGEGFTNNIQYYYTSIVLAGIFLATVEACARRGQTATGRRFMVAFVFAAALASNVAWSPSPLSVKFHNGIWAPPEPKDKFVNEAIALVPKDGSVSATYDIDSHMTHRALIYEYPNPWVIANWGLGATWHPPDPARVDWVVLNTELTGDQTVLYQELMRSEFKAVFNHDGILVLHRVKPGRHDDHDWP